MARFEYRVCAVRGDTPDHVEEELNSSLRRLGEEGWRFVETIYARNGLPLLLFKKQGKLDVKLGGEKAASTSPGKSKQK